MDPPPAATAPAPSVSHSVASPQSGASWSASAQVAPAAGLAGVAAAVRAMREEAAGNFTAALDLAKAAAAAKETK